jgi:hypothetical protein
MNTGVPGEYTMCSNGHVTLYSSCFAAMTLYYLDAFADMDEKERRAWIAYIQQYQDPKSGLFVGPEIVPGELGSPFHDREHITMHLTAHAIPALSVLGARPVYPLFFAHPFLKKDFLRSWLDRRDWKLAWLEGNNLLFVGQFLVWLRDMEEQPKAEEALELYFEWLDGQQDSATGLWGTDGFVDAYHAMYGGYHQLLVYHFCHRAVNHMENIIDTTLGLQDADGGFARYGGGGACEDVDAVDILVNLFKRTGYRPKAVTRALSAALDSVLARQLPDGGFVYRKGETFCHMGIARTKVPPDVSDLFSTWFGTHTVALACEVLKDHPLSSIPWRFNTVCSMGWHAPLVVPAHQKDLWWDRLPRGFLAAAKYVKATGRALAKRVLCS